MRMICRRGALFLVLTWTAAWGSTARAQGLAAEDYRAPLSPYFAAPGNYGTAYGVASYAVPRTYTRFTSPSGLGYGYGYGPYGILPGPYGQGLWRPGATAPGYAYYSTWPVLRGQRPPAPGIGVYAPAFGPAVYPALIQ